MTKMGNSVIRFWVAFVVWFVFLGALSASAAGRGLLHRPLTAATTRTSSWLLAPFGRVSVSGVRMEFDGFAADIADACDGVLPTLLYVAAVLALPARFRDRAWGVSVGVVAIFAINVLRVTTLMMLGARQPEIFEWVHVYVWQALVVALSMAVWLVWAELSVRQVFASRS
jgi:exosortase H (IPTLxxWG-CTERM-specific)